MNRTISVQSIQKANTRLINRQFRSFSSDGTTATIRCRTANGTRTLYVPTQKILDAANNAMKQLRPNG